MREGGFSCSLALLVYGYIGLGLEAGTRGEEVAPRGGVAPHFGNTLTLDQIRREVTRERSKKHIFVGGGSHTWAL